MKNTIVLATIVASSFLAGCSSGGGSSNPVPPVAVVTPAPIVTSSATPATVAQFGPFTVVPADAANGAMPDVQGGIQTKMNWDPTTGKDIGATYLAYTYVQALNGQTCSLLMNSTGFGGPAPGLISTANASIQQVQVAQSVPNGFHGSADVTVQVECASGPPVSGSSAVLYKRYVGHIVRP